MMLWFVSTSPQLDDGGGLLAVGSSGRAAVSLSMDTEPALPGLRLAHRVLSKL
jgi:hypothetical protein